LGGWRINDYEGKEGFEPGTSVKIL
jgi:hypothetical protein